MPKIVICALVLLGSLMIFNAIHADYQPSPGDVIKVDDKTKPALYLIDNQSQRQLFSNAVTFWTWYSGNWSNIKDLSNSKVTIKYISQVDFEKLSSAKNVVVRANSKLLKFNNSDNIYAVTGDGIINKIANGTDDSVARKLYGDNYKTLIIIIQSSFEGDYTEGLPLTIDSVVTRIDATPPVTANNSCVVATDTAHMDVFDSHAHISPTISASQIISEMNKAGVSVTNLYSVSLDTVSQYPGRFIAFVDTPDSPPDWFTQGQAFVTSAEAMLKTGKYYGIGETNLRYWGGKGSAPTLQSNVSPDDSLWLQLVNLSAQYHVPISFHFDPDDAAANAAFERMLNSNNNATFIWAHLGFNGYPLNRTTLNDFLLRYPNLYFDTAGIQNMQQDPGPQTNSNWWLLADQSNNGKLKAEWKKFFETWNSRILFGSDAGGGGNSLERWLNYSSNTSDGATADAVGHWKSLLSYLDPNAALNILSGNAKALFLKKQKPAYNYSVASNGQCYSISVISGSSVSALTFNSSTRAITFTVADSNGTTGKAVVTIPNALAGKSFTATVDGQSVTAQTTSNSVNTTITVAYAGGIKLVTLKAR